MIISKLLRIFSVLALFIFMVSCDLFLPAPVGRDNPDDPDVQIRGFGAVISGNDSIVTAWDWREASSAIPGSQVIDEIWIVHSENNPPTSRSPRDSDEVQKFDSRTFWKADWLNLSSNEEHYFALYAKESGGTWLAPIYTKVHLDSSPQQNSFTLYPQSPPNGPEQFSVWEVYNPAFTPSDVTNYSTLLPNPGNLLILNFNIYEQIYFDQFLLHLENGVPGSDVNLTIYAMKKNLTNVIDWADLVSEATIDYDSAVVRQITIAAGTSQSIDISEVANKMFMYDVRSLVISVDNSITFHIMSWSIDVHFWGKN